MRQETKNSQGDKLIYGDDHIEGLFFEVWSYDGSLLQFDSKMHNGLLTMGLIASIVEDYGFDLSAEVEEEIVEDND